MDDYRSNYKGKIFGVKRIQNFFAVEETNVFGDLTKYDFILKDSCIYSNNGNYTYQRENFPMDRGLSKGINLSPKVRC